MVLKLGESPLYIQLFLCFFHIQCHQWNQRVKPLLVYLSFSLYVALSDTFAFWWNQNMFKFKI